MKTLSIVVPAFNEEQFIGVLLGQIVQVATETAGFVKEIVVVDDGSTDMTLKVAAGFPGVKCVRLDLNCGKGAAVQRGIDESSGDYILVQDADLEYDPRDYISMLQVVGDSPGIAVYGSRVIGQIARKGWFSGLPGKHKEQGIGPWLAGVILSICTLCLYGRWISDTLTAYKLYPASILKSFSIKTKGFETDHEITAKLIQAGVKIIEVPIQYKPRSRKEGKKIRARDGIIAVMTLLRFRFGSR